MSHGKGLSVISNLVVAVSVAFAATPAFAQRTDWNDLRLDGSSAEAFQASVSALQNALPASERASFEATLAAIWLGSTANGGDVDKDGDFELSDIRDLTADSADLLADIQRGDLVAALEALDEGRGRYTAADYFGQLDGLGYESVLNLAGRLNEISGVGQALRAYRAQLLCRDPTALPLRQLWCTKFFRSKAATSGPRVPVGDTLSMALEALKAGDTGTAEGAVESLNLDQLTPFERGMAEALLFNVKYRQRLYPAARKHLQAAVDSGVISQADAEQIIGFIGRLEGMAAPDGPSIMPNASLDDDPASRVKR